MDECLLESPQSIVPKLEKLAAREENVFRKTPTSNFNARTAMRRIHGGIYAGSRGGYDSSTNLGIVSGLQRLRLFNAGRRSSTPSFTPAHTRVLSIAREPGRSTDSDSNTGANAAGGSETQNPTVPATSTGGIRSMCINPSRTLLAIGSGDLLQVTIYTIPEFEPVGVMYGHTDVVFGLAWISDTVLTSGSRDGSMRVWSMDSPILTTLPTVARPVEVRRPVITRSEEKSRVRDLSLNKGTGVRMMCCFVEGMELCDLDLILVYFTYLASDDIDD